MREVKLREAQLLMKTILADVDKICNKYDIDYWIESGTLLGAVRHGGFIPWDDDIDIAMKREDYKKFAKIAKLELPEDLIVENIKSDRDVLYNWIKVKHLYSKIEEEGNYCINQGLFIDIFPYDYYEENCELWKEKKKNIFKIKTIYNSELKFEKNLVKNAKRFFCKLYNKLIIKETMTSYREYCVEKAMGNEQKSKKYIGYGTEVDLFETKHEVKDIFPTKKIKFEDIEVRCPNNSEKILKEVYGENFMEIPKVEDRYSHNIGLYIKRERI